VQFFRPKTDPIDGKPYLNLEPSNGLSTLNLQATEKPNEPQVEINSEPGEPHTLRYGDPLGLLNGLLKTTPIEMRMKRPYGP
jgi:hypothetical protein